MSAQLAQALVDAQGTTVLVIGDVMLDEYVIGDADRISPEAPVPVVRERRRSVELGGAGNAAANVRALGGEATLLALVGDDVAGAALRGRLAACNVRDAVLVSSSFSTTTKTRIIAGSQQIVRLDREEPGDVDNATAQKLIACAARELSSVDVVLISDYQKGVVTEAVAREIISLALTHDVPVVVDPKCADLRRYGNATCLTPNAAEARAAAPRHLADSDNLEAIGEALVEILGGAGVVLTRGAEGMLVLAPGRAPVYLDAAEATVFDVTGAGDTVAATLALLLGAGADICEAATVANVAAGIVVGQLGAVTASADEIIGALTSRRTADVP